MGCQNCILRVQRHFLQNFFHRILLIGTVSEKIQLVLSKLHSTFPGNIWGKQFSKSLFWFFLVFARFFKQGLPKLYSTCPEALFADFLSQNRNKWHCERKNSSGFVKTAFYFPGNFWAKQFSKSSIWFFFVVLAGFFKHGLPKLYSKCPEAFFAEFFSLNRINWHCDLKNLAGFVRTAFCFSVELLSPTILIL